MLKTSMALTLAMLMLGSAVTAKELVIETLDAPDFLAGVRSVDGCLVGNPNGIHYAIPNWIWGAETYTYLYDPLETCGCSAGFEIDAVHMIVQFGAEDVPQSFEASVAVGGAVWNADSGRWEPGPAICSGPVTGIDITAPGLYDIVLPMESCGCMELVHRYAISYTFEGFFSSPPDVVTDNLPQPGTSWNDYGLGWYDLVVDFGYPGNLLMWADATCCESPVGDEPASWGTVKSLYR